MKNSLKKFSEYKLEQYLRFPEELTVEEKKNIEHFIQSSEEAREIVSWLKDFYREYDAVIQSRTKIIPLKPLLTELGSGGPVVLAAMPVSEKPKQGLLTKAILVSEEYKTLVRILEDEQSTTLQFHILSKSRDEKEHAILSIANPRLDLVTDKNGKLKNVKGLSDIEWDSVSAVLRLPHAKIRLNISSENVTPDSCEVLDTGIKIKKNSGGLSLLFENPGTRLSRVLTVQANTSTLQLIEEGKVHFEVTGEGDVTLYFYE